METVRAPPVIVIMIALRMAMAGRRATKAFGRMFRRRVVTRSMMIGGPATVAPADEGLETATTIVTTSSSHGTTSGTT
jgi:hypothetical protein